MNRIFGFICGLLIAASVPLLMAQVSGPTTRTPRLTVGNPATAVTSGGVSMAGNLNVQGTTTLTGACTGGGCGADPLGNYWLHAATASLVNGVILPLNGDLFTATWATGCSNDPANELRVQMIDTIVTIVFVTTATCTSDGTDLATTTAPLTAVYRPTADARAKYTALSIAGVQTDACLIILTTGNLQWRTGAACGTLPGNVAKVITAGAQNTVTYNTLMTN